MSIEYDPIFTWNMSQDEAEVYKLAILYQKIYQKMFKEDTNGENFRKNSLSKNGDPRKSNLYRHCWKLKRETRGLIEEDQYKDYFVANFTILKSHNAFVAPNSVCGDKAWVRWKLWKRWYDQKMAELADKPAPPSVKQTNPKIIAEIDRTKKFLFEKCNGSPSKEKIKEFLDGGLLKMWFMMQKVSPYYVSLSPFIEDKKSFFESCSFDPLLIRDTTTDEVKNYFSHEFKHEYS